MEIYFAIVLILCGIANQASGHGRMMDPVARASAWRLGFPTPKNYDDNALFCGGFANKQRNGGKCGVCGDPWTQKEPRQNEAGGRYGKGVIVKTYKIGQVVTIKSEITANHFGWMEYRICPNNNPNRVVTQKCLDEHVLQRADGKGPKYMIDSKRVGLWSMDYVLPAGMTCTQCVIQWKYHAGNSWGVDPDTGRGCMGCGPQEEFYGCADVAIVSDSPVQPRVTQPPVTFAPRTNPPATFAPRTNPPMTFAPRTNPPVHITQKQTTQRPHVETPKEFIGAKTGNCIAINNWLGDAQMNKWCNDNCFAGNCPTYACDCSGGVTNPPTPAPTTPTPTTTKRPTTTSTTSTTSTTTPTTTTRKTTTTSTTTTPKPTPRPTTKPTPKPTTQQQQATTTNPLVHVVNRVECHAVNLWAGNEYLDRWCADGCAHGNCPPEQCECVIVQRLVTKTTTTTEMPEPQTTTKTPVVVPTTKICHAISVWKDIDVFDIWCTTECNKDNCPPETCVCTDTPLIPSNSQTTKRPSTTSTSTSTTTTTTTTAKPDVTSYTTCSSKGVVAGDYWNGWCQNHCDGGYCPIDYCTCQ